MKLKIVLFLGNLSTAFVQFLIIFILARFGELSDVGKYTYVFALLSPIFIFINMKIRSVVATDTINQFKNNEYFSFRIISLIITILFSLGLILILDQSYLTFAILILLFKSFEILSEFNFGLWQRDNKFIYIALSLIIKNSFASILFVLTYLVYESFIISMSFIILIYFVAFIIENNKTKVLYSFRFDSMKFYSILKLTYSLGISGTIAALVINIPRYILEYSYTENEVGIYGVISYFLVLFNIFISSIGQILLPKLNVLYYKQKYTEFQKLLKKSIFMGLFYGIALLCITYLFAEEIILLTVGENYSDYNSLLVILVTGAVFMYTTVYLGTALNAMRKFKVQVYINLISLITIFLFSLILIPNKSIEGAALATMYTNIVSAITYIIVYLLFIGRLRNEKN